MNSKRVYFIMLGLVIVLSILTIATTLLGDTLLKKQSAKLVEVKLESQVLESEQLALRLAKNDLEKYVELHKIAKQIVPSDKDQARAVREIINIANETGINIAGISFPDSTLGQKKPAAKEKKEGETQEPEAATTTTAITQAVPAKGIPGLYELDININSSVTDPATYPQLISFLEKLENNRRTSHVTGLTIQPDTNNNALISFVLTVTVYLKP